MGSVTPPVTPPQTKVASMEEAIERCKEKNSYPMFAVNNKVSKLVPNPRAFPTVWRWPEMRKIMMDTSPLVPEEEAERRALMMVNPGFPEAGHGPSPYTTDTLYAGYQLVMPGETAPAHRHIAYAVRFILESDKGFTSVSGHKIYLEPGDLVLTPSWTWHYHGNDGPTPTMWVDCLDIPLHVFARVNFLEVHPTPKVPDHVTEGSPFHFPWKVAQRALDAQTSPRAIYNYLTCGNHFSKSIAAQAERISKGYKTAPSRETVCFIYIVHNGQGSTTIKAPTGEKTIEWKTKDVFVVPSWSWVEHQCGEDADAYLFTLTDRAFEENLGLSRISFPDA